MFPHPNPKLRAALALAVFGTGAAILALFSSRNGPAPIPIPNPVLIPASTPVRRFTVAERMTAFAPRAGARWKPYFERAGVVFPPAKLVFLGLKTEKQLEIYARNRSGEWKWVRSLPIARASGEIGPKLREGDFQVPEGFYEIESLNPNSAYHLAIRVSYPSTADRQIAAREKRDTLGGNIMIHGGNLSIGCLAMVDEAAEDLFVLAQKSGRENVRIVLCPLDFRDKSVPRDPNRPDWVQKRYAKLAQFVQTLPRDPN